MSGATGSVPTFYVCDSTTYRPATAAEALAAARQTISFRFRHGRVLNSPSLIREYLRVSLAALEHEVFCVVLPHYHQRLLACVEMVRGPVGKAVVHPRQVVKEALKHNAAAVILAHNDPYSQ